MFNWTITHRWNPENKANMDPYAFLPFGTGPRSCIAKRFALEELKLALCTFVTQFRFFAVEETPVKISYVNFYFNFLSDVISFWSKFQMKLTSDKGFSFGTMDPLESTVGIASRI